MRKMITTTAALLTLALAACGGGGDGPTEPDTVAGSYALKTVDGKSVPLVLYEEPGYKFELISSTYTLNAAGGYTTVASWKETSNGAVSTGTETSSGTYTASGPNLSFTSPGGDPFSGTRVGNTLTLKFEDMTAVYIK